MGRLGDFFLSLWKCCTLLTLWSHSFTYSASSLLVYFSLIFWLWLNPLPLPLSVSPPLLLPLLMPCLQSLQSLSDSLPPLARLLFWFARFLLFFFFLLEKADLLAMYVLNQDSDRVFLFTRAHVHERLNTVQSKERLDLFGVLASKIGINESE